MHGNADDGRRVKAELVRVHHPHNLDDVVVHKAVDAVAHCAFGDARGLGDLGVRRAAITLQVVEDCEIKRVHARLLR